MLKYFTLFIFSIIVTIISLEEYNKRTRYYTTYQEAITSNYSKNGWIREFVPKDAYQISDWHILSPQEQILTFNFVDEKKFNHSLHSCDFSHIKVKKLEKYPLPKIPSYISEHEHPDFYQVTDGEEDGCLIVSWLSKKAYFYSRNCLK